MTSVELKPRKRKSRPPATATAAPPPNAFPDSNEPERRSVFDSVLFPTPEDRVTASDPPGFFIDLNCDQIVDAIAAGKEQYDLKPFFYAPLPSIAAIEYRQDVMRDLEQQDVLAPINAFAERMRDMRACLSHLSKLHYKEQRQAWFLDAVGVYCEAVLKLDQQLSIGGLRSPGLQSFREYLRNYVSSQRFTSIAADQGSVKDQLERVRYSVLIKGDSFTVRGYADEVDYSENVERTFAKFKQGSIEDYRVKFSNGADMDHIEAKILEFVAKLNPEAFAALDGFYRDHADFRDETLIAFDREVQFYVAYLGYIEELKQAGLQFCYPLLSDNSKHIFDRGSFDLALAHKLADQRAPIVCNDFELSGAERILVVSGPNQGGKTTFARTFGQLHYLASIGCPVPGADAQLFHFDRLFTHFEKEEKVENFRGKLEDDLIRVRDILEHATPRSIIVMNEIFTSTTLQDETLLSKKVMERLIDLDVLCVWVTFVEELAAFGVQTVSMVSTVVPEDPTIRTFKILRRPADGLAYAAAIARKYGLTYEAIKKRIGQ